MTSYYDDESPYPPQGRSRVPGSGGPGDGGGYGGGYEPAEEFDPFAPEHQPPSPPAPPSRGRASVRPPDGFDPDQAVGPGGYPGGGFEPSPYQPARYEPDPYQPDPYQPADPYQPPDPYAPAGPGGGMDEGFDPFGDEFGGPPMGRASVPPAAGRASVGRASIPPMGPAGPGGPRGPRPGGPTGPGGPDEPGGPEDEGGGRKRRKKKQLTKAEKRKRRIRRLIASFATIVILFGLLFLGGAWYYNSITIPNPPQVSATQILYSDGSVMAQIGQISEQDIGIDQMPLLLQHAVVATEDETFYTNPGIDVKGIIRAFFNNITGGQTQGASTITQQYADHLESFTKDQSYTRKAKEAFIALKITRTWTKPEILEKYLNTTYFGRGATGVQAAAQAFFHVNAADLNSIANLPMAIVLADMIRSPAGSGATFGPYDPSCALLSASQQTQLCPDEMNRFQYTINQMVKLGWLDQATAATLKYPSDRAVPWSDVQTGANQNMDKPEGFIVKQVVSELNKAIDPATGKPYVGTDGQPLFSADGFLKGGYKILTTINKNAQQAADSIFNIYAPGTPFYKKFPTGLGAEGVAISPSDGSVLAYFGGPNGSGLDYAGVWYDVLGGTPDGLSGGHRDPGSSLKTITMATALSEGYGLDSMWNGPDPLPRPNGQAPLHNAGQGDTCDYCPMWEGLKRSTNTLFFNVGQEVGIPNIAKMAANLGVTHVWQDFTGQVIRYDMSPGNPGKAANPGVMPNEMAFGQAGVDLQDLVHVMGTIANSGKLTTEHFVQSVAQTQISGTKTVNATVYSATFKSTQVPGVTPQMMDDEMWAMQQVMANGDENNPRTALTVGADKSSPNGFTNQLAGGRPAAAKTGTWELSGSATGASSQNGVAAFNGFTAPGPGQVAASVWVGDVTQKRVAVQILKDGKPSSNLGGATGAGPIWKMFMDAVLKYSNKGKAAPIEQFPPRVGTGYKQGTGTPPPSATPSVNPSFPGGGGFGNVPAPTNVQATATGTSTIELTWDPIPPGETYTVTRNGQPLNGVTATGLIDNGLSEGQTYYYEVVASIGPNQSQPVQTSATTLTGGGGGGGGGATAPPTPANLKADTSQAMKIIFSWDASTGATSYSVTVTRNGQQVVTQAVSPTSVSVTVSGGPPHQTYKISVAAVGQGGAKSPPATLSVTT